VVDNCDRFGMSGVHRRKAGGQARMKAGQDQMRAKIKTNQQETKAFQAKVEDNQEKKEAQMKPC
jgi:hypothetical protein